MAKKNKKFIKKRRPQSAPVPQEPKTTNITADEVIETVAKDDPAAIEALEAADPYKTEYAYVRRDIVKILIIMASIIILLFLAYYLTLKTSVFDSFGNWIFKAAHINID